MNDLRSFIVLCAVFLLVGPETLEARSCKYKFKMPRGGNAVEKRLVAIDDVTQRCRGRRKCREACSMYEMEAGLILQHFRAMEQDAIQHYRRALEFDRSNCDARLLLSSLLSKKSRDPDALAEASRLMIGDLRGCSQGTVATFHRARMGIFSLAPDRIAAGRTQLEGLSTLSLGESGVTQSDVYNTLLFSYLAQTQFEEAARRMEERPNGVQLSPKLLALMLIGEKRADELGELSDSDRATVRAFLLEELESYRPQSELERLTSQATEELRTLQAIPWRTLEQEWVHETPWQTEVQRTIVEDEYQRMQRALDSRHEALQEIERGLERLRLAELELLRQEIEKGTGSREGVEFDAIAKYTRAHGQLSRSMETLTEALQAMATLGYLEHFLADPEAFVEEARTVSEFEERRSAIQGERILDEILEGFALAKSRSLKPGDLLDDFVIQLDQLGPRSEKVKQSVRRLAPLENRSI